MRLLTLAHYFAHLISPCGAVIAPLLDYFTVYDWADMSFLDKSLVIIWTVILVISIRTTISITFIIMQHMFFLNYYFKYHFLNLKVKLRSVIKRTEKRKWKSGSFAKTEKILISLRKISLKFLRFRDHTKHAAYLMFMTLIGTVEFDLYILIDYRTTTFLKTITADQIPFVGLILFINFYMMSELNSKSKYILVELDKLIHGGGQHYAKMNGQILDIEKIVDQRLLIDSDRISINMCDIFNLVRCEITQTSFQVVNNLFLIINSNR